jgi:hypothetical protein
MVYSVFIGDSGPVVLVEGGPVVSVILRQQLKVHFPTFVKDSLDKIMWCAW